MVEVFLTLMQERLNGDSLLGHHPFEQGFQVPNATSRKIRT